MFRFKMKILVLLLVYLGKLTNAYFDCSMTTCSCSEDADRGFNIDCPNEFERKVQISFDLDEYSQRNLEVDCINNEDFQDYLPTRYLPPETSELHLDFLGFKACKMPEGGVTMKQIMKALHIERANILRISYSDLGNVTRHALMGLEDLEHLQVLNYNKISSFSDDLLYDLKNLTSLDIKANGIVIPQKFLQGTPRLKWIEMAENFLPENTTEMFLNLDDLEQLNMWNMKIENLEPTIFNPLHNLKVLELSTNQINELPQTIFGELRKLKTLSLRRNNLTELPYGLFENNTRLEVLNLNENPHLSKIPHALLANLTNLRNVTIAYCNLTVLSKDMFSGSYNLIDLDLSYNNIESLPDKFLKDQDSLLVLNLERNSIKQLSREFFANFRELLVLNLKDNYFELQHSNFPSLSKLKSLNLADNGLTKVYRDTFRGLRALKELDLSNNQLTLLEESSRDLYGEWSSAMLNLESLETLLLSRNNISIMFSDWRFSKWRLKTLDLSYNKFTNVSFNDLQFIQQNIVVNLEHNEIIDINMKEAELTVYTNQNFSKHGKYAYVKLNHNPLHCSCNLYDLYRYFNLTMDPEVRSMLEIESSELFCATPEEMAKEKVNKIAPKTFVCKISNEEANVPFCPDTATCYRRPSDETLTMDLSFNGLEEVPVLNHFKDLNNLRFKRNVVLLQGNNLREMPKPKMGYEKIHVLDLSHNNISNIEWLPNTTEVLFLHDNNLTHLSSKALKMLNQTHLTSLTLYNNPWECNCSTVDFIKFIQDHFQKMSNLGNMTCRASGIRIDVMTSDQLCPDLDDVLVLLCVMVALVSIIGVVSMALYFRYKMEIKVWLFAHQQCLWFVTEEELDKDKIYDAFISYSHKDEDFIIAELISNLESGPKPYKLCLHFRNWQPGEFISKNIANSIADSRRTIVILSPNFLESEWGKMEFRTAHKQALEENRARVIVILLGDIPMDNLDEEIKAYLNTNTYLKWGDPWFWDKLRYALPHSRRISKNIPQTLEKITIDGDKLDLMQEPTTPSIESTPPADKITFDPMIKNGILNVSLVNGSLVNGSLVNGSLVNGGINNKLDQKLFISR